MYNLDVLTDRFICGDSLEIMRGIPSDSVPLIITSPPYNISGAMSISKNGRGKWNKPALSNGYDGNNDNMSHEKYVEWQRGCLDEMMRIIPSDGAIFYNHKWRIQKGILQDRSDILRGFPVRQIIIWQRAGGHNFTQTFFLPTYEVVYMITKPKFRLAKGANGFGDVWKINQEQKNKHPAPFPVELPHKIISATNADIILDPFMGSGTTALAACMHVRHFIGIDQSAQYCANAQARIDAYTQTINTEL